MNVLSRAIFSPLLLTIEADLHLSHAQASGFFMLISAGLSLTMFFSGFLSSKLTHRQVIVLSAVLCGLSLIAVSFSTSLLGIRISLFFVGMGAGLYLPSGIATVSSLVVPRDLGKAMATHELGPTIGFVAGPIFVGLLSKYTSWRSILIVIGLMNLLMAFLFAFFGRGGDFAGLKPNLKNLRSILTHPNFWIMTALFGVAVGGEQGVYALLPTYLVSEKGLEYVSANTIFGLSRISVILTIVISLAALSRIGSQHFTNVIVSMIIPISTLFGWGVVPSLLGILGEHGSFPIGFIFLGTTMLLSTVLFSFLKL